jgi:hypothetical protein
MSEIDSDFAHLIAQSHSSNFESCRSTFEILSINDYSRDEIWFHNLDDVLVNKNRFIFISSIDVCSEKRIFISRNLFSWINVIDILENRLSSKLRRLRSKRLRLRCSIRHLFEFLWTINYLHWFWNIYHYFMRYSKAMSCYDFIVEIFFNDVFNSKSLQEWCLKNLNQITFNFNNNFVNKKNLISFFCRILEIDFANVFIINQFIKTVKKEFNKNSNQINFIFRSLNSLNENENIFSESLCELRSHVIQKWFVEQEWRFLYIEIHAKMMW